MKSTADIYEHFEGSDDPRAIEGGGGAGSRRIETFTASRYLIERWVSIWNARGENFSFVVRTR